MYNRYIPRPDGSYACNRIPEPQPNRPQKRQPTPPPPPKPKRQEEAPCEEKEQRSYPKHQGQPLGFLRQLFGKDFDTGDLLVILLLLLMAGDCEEDRSNALLTIALYFMM